MRAPCDQAKDAVASGKCGERARLGHDRALVRQLEARLVPPRPRRAVRELVRPGLGGWVAFALIVALGIALLSLGAAALEHLNAFVAGQ